jgi:serine O-acetyltransferase
MCDSDTLTVADDDTGRAGAPQGWNLDKVVCDLRTSREITHNIRHKGRVHQVPSYDALATVVNQLAIALFPTHYGKADLFSENIDYLVGNTLNDALSLLNQQVWRDLAFTTGEEAAANPRLASRASSIVRQFAGKLPDIRAALVEDLRAAYRGDPAATNYPEILLGYPGMTAMIHYRLARALFQLGSPLVARLIGHIGHFRTAIDIHPGAQIGRSFFIDHGTGVVIGETAVIGDNVRLYQALTLGARSFQTDADGALVKGLPRHPIVEDDVVIYAGATILGHITIGRGSVIGGNVWLTRSVAPNSNITQANAG